MRIRPMVVLAATLAACAAAAVVALVVVVASVAGPQFPSSDDLPDLPEGYDYGVVTEGCGSGGCWITVEVAAPGDVAQSEAFAAVDEAVSGCGTRTLIDRRSQCTSVARSASGGATVTISLRDLGK